MIYWLIDIDTVSFAFPSDLGENVEAEQMEPKGQKTTTTPPSTPVRAEEGMLSWQTLPACLV